METKFLCKKDGVDGNQFTFIKDKWYDGSWEWTFTIFKKYWVVNEQGHGKYMSKAEMNDLFYMKLNEVRDKQIEEILK